MQLNAPPRLVSITRFELVGLHAHQKPVARYARVVHEHVDAPEPVLDVGHHLLDGVEVGNVALGCTRRNPEIRGQAVRQVLRGLGAGIAVMVHHHGEAVGGKTFGHGGPYSLGRPCD